MDINRIVNKISLLHSVSDETPTSIVLADIIINQMDLNWKDPTLKILDPACGRGTVLLSLIKKLEAHGHSRKHIITNMIYGVDINRVQVMIAKKALKMVLDVESNIYCDNSLTRNWNMKFDAYVGNPPFQESKDNGDRKDQASNLWSKFWALGFELAKDDGVVALITPTSWLSPSADLKGTDKIDGCDRLWDVFNKHTSYADVVNVAKHFQGVGSSFGYVIVDRAGTNGLTFSDGVSTSLGFRPKSNYAQVQAELDLVNNIGSNFSVNQANTPDLRVSIPLTRGLTPTSIEILNGVATPTAGSDNDTLYLYIHVNTQAEAVRVQSRVQTCIDILNTHCRWSGFMNIQAVKLISY